MSNTRQVFHHRPDAFDEPYGEGTEVTLYVDDDGGWSHDEEFRHIDADGPRHRSGPISASRALEILAKHGATRQLQEHFPGTWQERVATRLGIVPNAYRLGDHAPLFLEGAEFVTRVPPLGDDPDEPAKLLYAHETGVFVVAGEGHDDPEGPEPQPAEEEAPEPAPEHAEGGGFMQRARSFLSDLFSGDAPEPGALDEEPPWSAHDDPGDHGLTVLVDEDAVAFFCDHGLETEHFQAHLAGSPQTRLLERLGLASWRDACADALPRMIEDGEAEFMVEESFDGSPPDGMRSRAMYRVDDGRFLLREQFGERAPRFRLLDRAQALYELLFFDDDDAVRARYFGEDETRATIESRAGVTFEGW